MAELIAPDADGISSAPESGYYEAGSVVVALPPGQTFRSTSKLYRLTAEEFAQRVMEGAYVAPDPRRPPGGPMHTYVERHVG